MKTRKYLQPFGSNGINFVDEDNGRRIFLSHTEELSHKLGPVSEVFLNQLRTNDAQEGGRGLVCDSLCEQLFRKERKKERGGGGEHNTH